MTARTEEWLLNYERKRAGQPVAQDFIKLVLPLPPTVNNLYKGTGTNKRLTPAQAAFRAEVGRIVGEMGNPRLGAGRLAVTIAVVPPDGRAFDLDNRLKAALDALQAADVIDDDAAIDDLHIYRLPVGMPGQSSATVTISRVRL